MIQAEELRIGNLYLKDGKICVVGELRSDHCLKLIDNCKKVYSFQNMHFYGNIEPIPLTEDILLKCGFYYNNFLNHYCLRITGCKVYEKLKDLDKDDYELQFYDMDLKRLFINDLLIDCKFLHELQNLYYALTKQELDVTKILEDE